MERSDGQFEKVYRAQLRELHRTRELRDGLSVDHAVAAVRAIASVDAWHFFVHERRWKQDRAVDAIVNAVEGAVFR